MNYTVLNYTILYYMNYSSYTDLCKEAIIHMDNIAWEGVEGAVISWVCLHPVAAQEVRDSSTWSPRTIHTLFVVVQSQMHALPAAHEDVVQWNNVSCKSPGLSCRLPSYN